MELTISPAALDFFRAALSAFGAGDPARAWSECGRAAEMAPESRVFAAAKRALTRITAEGVRGVYVDGEAFGAFIRGGGNVALYRAVSPALQRAYAEHPGARLLDVGVGDGLALLPALDHHISLVTLVEPSAPMLEITRAALAERRVPHEAVAARLEDLARDRPDARWDLAQATFSLQSIPRDARRPLLRWLRGATPHLLLVEFDVPSHDDPLEEAWIRHVVTRYERGLAEHEGDSGLVEQGFLLPVMLGYFAPSARANDEQPISTWVEDLRQAGFSRVSSAPIHDYWWATAHLVDARA